MECGHQGTDRQLREHTKKFDQFWGRSADLSKFPDTNFFTGVKKNIKSAEIQKPPG